MRTTGCVSVLWNTIIFLIVLEHNIASERKSEQEFTCVLNLIFQYENDEGVVNLSN